MDGRKADRKADEKQVTFGPECCWYESVWVGGGGGLRAEHGGETLANDKGEQHVLGGVDAGAGRTRLQWLDLCGVEPANRSLEGGSQRRKTGSDLKILQLCGHFKSRGMPEITGRGACMLLAGLQALQEQESAKSK